MAPSEQNWNRSSIDGSCARCVHFRGNIDNADIAGELQSAQVFVFPSLREFGGGVVLEAMASGLPSIIVDYGGPAELVTSDSGILLPMRRRDEMVVNLRAAMESLASDSARCRVMSDAGVARVRDHFTWMPKPIGLRRSIETSSRLES